ncbi:MAG: iron-sulfur cluster assembly accessory protein [Candidatus Makana argininalis]
MKNKIIITNSAAKQINFLTTKDNSMIGLRLLLKKSGCAGFKYILRKVKIINKKDQIYEKKGAKIFVSSKILYLINGTEIDYVKEKLNEEFKFNNPKANHYCGCGKSFGI